MGRQRLPPEASTMRQRKSGQQRLNRIQLIARVQLAYEQLHEARERRSTEESRVAVHEARRRLDLLNRALALLTLQSMGPGVLA